MGILTNNKPKKGLKVGWEIKRINSKFFNPKKYRVFFGAPLPKKYIKKDFFFVYRGENFLYFMSIFFVFSRIFNYLVGMALWLMGGTQS